MFILGFATGYLSWKYG